MFRSVKIIPNSFKSDIQLIKIHKQWWVCKGKRKSFESKVRIIIPGGVNLCRYCREGKVWSC